MISRGISDGRGLEEGRHFGGTPLQAAHVGSQTGLERRHVPWRATARHRLLEIVVEEFVGIVLGRVGRQVTLLHGYAKSLKKLNTSKSVNRHKCLILLDSCRIHATRWL